MNGETGFLHLNLDGEWPTFAPGELHGLEVAADGSLVLETAGDAFRRRGVFRGGPFEALDGPTPWYRLRALAEPLPEAAHLQLFTFVGDGADAPYDPTAELPFGGDGWRAAPRDLLDVLILQPPARRLWVGGVVRSDGGASPRLHQMRVDWGRDTYLRALPETYARDEARRELLERFLSLHESVLGGLEGSISDLPRLFDPAVAPAGEPPSWLTWLAGWLAFELNQAWSDEETRRYLAQAFELYGWRGTREGLRRYLKLYAGVEARIEEPGLATRVWSLGEASTLGFTTMLAPAHLQGAVLGTSATLDASHLQRRGGRLGAALFEDLAHHFCVQVYCAELTRPGALADAREVIEREKPAHTTYELCVIEPRMRVGLQARVGIDAIVAGGPPPARVGEALGGAALAAEAGPCREGTVPPAHGAAPCSDEEEL